MPRIVLNDLVIQKLPASEKYVTYYDKTFPAFGIRVGLHKRTWILMQGKARHRLSLGRYPYVSLKEARLKAHAALSGLLRPPAATNPLGERPPAVSAGPGAQTTQGHHVRDAPPPGPATVSALNGRVCRSLYIRICI